MKFQTKLPYVDSSLYNVESQLEVMNLNSVSRVFREYYLRNKNISFLILDPGFNYALIF